MELLGKRLIRSSRGSPYAAPAMFVPKGVDAEGRPQLRMVIDYRDLNRITIKDRFPLPHPEDLINRLTGMKRFSKLDFFSGYHQHRMHPDSIEKTAFIGPDGLYEWLVMPFGLANAPSEFMRLVNKLLEPHSDYCIVFLDDILIFSRNDAEHEKHVTAVLDTLRREGFRLKGSKCAFGREKAPFLGFEVDGAGVSMTEEKVKAISDWPDPETPKEMRIFVGLTGVYRRFVADYAKIAAPLLKVMTLSQSEYDRMKGNPAEWKQITVAVDLLKAAMIARPALALPEKGNHQFIVRTDASDFAIGGTLRQLQQDESGSMVDRIIAYFSRKLHDAETRYSTYDKQLLGVRDAIDHWRFYLKSGYPFKVQTDHSALQHILKQPKLTSRQMRLLQTLQEYDFEIEYYPGAKNYIQDALSRRPDYKDPPIPRINRSQQEAAQELLSTDVLAVSAVTADKWIEQLKEAYVGCPYFGDVIAELEHREDPTLTANQAAARKRRAKQYSLREDGIIIQRSTSRIAVPTTERRRILQEAHDSKIGGHFGAQRTEAMIARDFYWKGMSQDIKRYVRGCAACHRAKATNQKPYGLLQPLEVPDRRWERINVDFITKLPKTRNGNDTIITFIDSLTKRAHWVATSEKELTAERFAEIFIDFYFRLHGMPSAIVSDRDARFTSRFWQHLTTLWGTRTRMSTAFHPQSDGQAEKANSIVERYLRTFCAGDEKGWDSLLPLAEFSYNSHTHKAHGFTPFEADIGENPPMPLTLIGGAAKGEAGDFAQRMADTLILMKARLQQAQQTMMEAANQKRQPHTFCEGDKVMLKTASFPLTYGNAAPGDEDEARLSRTLQQRYIGPYTLGKRIGENAFRIVDLPDYLRKHRTLNVDQFKRCEIDEGRPQPPPPPVRVTKRKGAEWEVESIEDWRFEDGKPLFKIQWLGDEATWEPIDHLAGAKELVRDFVAAKADADLTSAVPRAYRPINEKRKRQEKERVEGTRRSARLREARAFMVEIGLAEDAAAEDARGLV
jgi:hypothetical protein